tara:strand:+ start:2735 stop:3178 length:444 start_codon:yes stop_codon:yes gene_type:complete
MATTTLTLGITSDVSSNAVDISTNFNVTTDGSTGVSESTGVSRIKVGTSDKLILDISGAPVTLIDKKAVAYFKNIDTTFANYIDIKIGNASTADQHAEVLRIYGGQFAVLPLRNSTDIDADGGIDADIHAKAANASSLLEFAVFYES